MKKASCIAMLFMGAFFTSCGDSAEPTHKIIVSEPVVTLPGEAIYKAQCVVCHQENGQGIVGAFPPLGGSDFIVDKEATIKQVLNGASGELVVNGVTYNGTMAAFGESLDDQQIADVLNYVYTSWGNSSEADITAEDVAGLRD